MNLPSDTIRNRFEDCMETLRDIHSELQGCMNRNNDKLSRMVFTYEMKIGELHHEKETAIENMKQIQQKLKDAEKRCEELMLERDRAERAYESNIQMIGQLTARLEEAKRGQHDTNPQPNCRSEKEPCEAVELAGDPDSERPSALPISEYFDLVNVVKHTPERSTHDSDGWSLCSESTEKHVEAVNDHNENDGVETEYQDQKFRWFSEIDGDTTIKLQACLDVLLQICGCLEHGQGALEHSEQRNTKEAAVVSHVLMLKDNLARGIYVNIGDFERNFSEVIDVGILEALGFDSGLAFYAVDFVHNVAGDLRRRTGGTW